MNGSASRIARACASGAMALGMAVATACGNPQPAPTVASSPPIAPVPKRTIEPRDEISPIPQLVNDAIVAHRLPGAVVQIGHGGTIVFRQAYGSRKLDGEPGLDGVPSPAEPMTLDTIFDLASLTKILATTTAVLQLYEQGKLQVDDAVQTYLPEFNAANDPRRAQVTLRMLLTHTSGIGAT